LTALENTLYFISACYLLEFKQVLKISQGISPMVISKKLYYFCSF